MYFLKTGSPAHLRWLKVFEPLMVITGIVQQVLGSGSENLIQSGAYALGRAEIAQTMQGCS